MTRHRRRAAPPFKARLQRISLKLIVASAAVMILAVDFAVTDAARSTEEALEALSRPGVDSGARAAVAYLAVEDLKARWSHPLLWHGGAVEAEAWALDVEAVAAKSSGSARDKASAAAGQSLRAVTLSPIAAPAWVRLQALTRLGVDPAGCGAVRCVEASYRAAPLTLRPDLECARFTLSRGAALETDDPKFYALAASGAGPQELAQCLAPLGPEKVFQALRLRRRIETSSLPAQ